MISTLSLFMLLLQAASSRAAQSPPRRALQYPTMIAITHVNVIDVAHGSRVADRTVVVRGTRILSVVSGRVAPPAGAHIVDGRGKFLIPGLWDMHGHVYPHAKGAPTDERAWQLPLYLAEGVTGVRDMWTNLEDFAQMRTWNSAAAEGRLIAPRLVSTGPMLDGPTGIFRDIAIVITSAADANRVVDSVASGGAHAVKIHNAIPRTAFFALAARAKERGLPLIGHVPTAVTVREAIAAGQSDIEHYTESDGCASAAAEAEAMRLRTDTTQRPSPGRVQQVILDGYDARRCADLMHLLVARGIWVTPTLVAAQYLLDPADPTITSRDELRYVPETERAQWTATRETALRRMSPSLLESRRRVFVAQQSLVGTMQRAGVRLMIGTDVSNDWLVPGFSVHDELALFVRSGMTPAEALRAATLTPAKYLHATDSLGTIATGHIADLVLLDANPLDDIHATKRIRAVIARGRYLDRAALDALISAASSATGQLSARRDPQDSTQFAFTHVTVTDVASGRSIADRTVVVRGSRILAVANGSAVPSAGTRIVDGRGKFLIPGLWDMHAHAVRDTPNTLPLFVANGITGVRDMGDDLDSTMAAAARDRRGPRASPRFVLAGAIIDGAPTVYPDASVTARTPAEGRHWVDSMAKRGVDFIKAYEMLRPEVAAAIVDEARMHHLGVVGHVPLTMNAGAVSDLGYRSIEHLRNVDVACSSVADSLIAAATDQVRAGERDGRPGGAVRGAIFDARAVRLLATFDPVRCDSLLRRFRRNNTWQVPTFVVGDFFFTRSDTTQRLRTILRFLPPSTRADWIKASRGLDTAQAQLAVQLGGTPALADLLVRSRARYHMIFRRMLALGVPVLAGTDFGNPWITPGFSLHDELALFVQDGMSPLDALRSATLSPAQFLGATDSLGTVAPGKLADLVLLDADPLLDIDNTRRIRAVVTNGRLFDRAALDTILATAECDAHGGSSDAPTLVLTQRVAQVDTEAAEPMIVEHPNGTLFAAGIGGPWPRDSEYYANRAHWDSLFRDRLWKSRDHGTTWTSVDLGPSARSVIGNSDVDLAAAADGTLYVASMTWADSVHEGQRIAIGVSHDVGATWSWKLLSEHRFDDRPWVVVAPDGSAHVIWNDGKGVQHVVSHDNGRTWSTPSRVHESGGSSHLAVGPHGELAVRLIPWSASHNFLNPGVDLIAVSTDGGTHWKMRRAPGQRDWGTWAPGAAHSGRDDSAQAFTGNRATNRCCSNMIVPHWIEPLAWDGEGRLYSLWPDTTGVWLARSADRGATWDTWRIVERRVRYEHGPSPVVHNYERDLVSRLHDATYYPYLVARGDGELAATWLVREGDSLHWQAARIKVDHGAAAPRVASSPLLELETFDPDSTRVSGLRRASSAGEYVGVTFLHDGSIGVITPIQIPFSRRLGFTYWRFKSP
jgi:imidazolonepropionase-like amidohydrolase